MSAQGHRRLLIMMLPRVMLTSKRPEKDENFLSQVGVSSHVDGPGPVWLVCRKEAGLRQA